MTVLHLITLEHLLIINGEPSEVFSSDGLCSGLLLIFSISLLLYYCFTSYYGVTVN